VTQLRPIHEIGLAPDDERQRQQLEDAEVDAYRVPEAGVLPDDAKRGDFTDRVRSRQLDLVDRIRHGIPPAEYLPASDLMLRRGKRHYWAAPKKVGKSLGALIHAGDMVLAGATVVVFDRENGGDLYASRLEAIINGREMSTLQQAQLSKNLSYYEFPRFRKDDGNELVKLCLNADLVIFDSQRMYLSDLGLEENSSDDYAEFMAALVDPLFAAGIATLILDNTGHGDSKRGRGASSKGDLNEVLFTLETIERYGLDHTGKVRLEITDSRFGDTGRWEMSLGAGKFGSWDKVEHTHDVAADGAFRYTGKMERVSIFIENCADPQGRNTICDAIGGKGQYVRAAIDSLIREGYARAIEGARGAKFVESLRPYREDDDHADDNGSGDGIPW
jgi:hypothetical protein